MKILVVEDEVQLADTLAEILKRNKYNVDTVFDGDDGLEYARTGIYDCILLDIMLPVRSGTEIVQILRQEKNATPIMLLLPSPKWKTRFMGWTAGRTTTSPSPFPPVNCWHESVPLPDEKAKWKWIACISQNSS